MIASTLLAALLLQTAPPEDPWYKGNTHAHTLWDDGDALPETVVEWYRSRGYHFLVLSDHNDRNALTGAERWTVVSGTRTRLRTYEDLRQAFDQPGRFALLPGQEIGDGFAGKLVHHTVLNSGRIILPPGGDSLREVLSRALTAVEDEGKRNGRPILTQLNHPNLGWAVSADDVTAVDERFLEIYNGHPAARLLGDADHPSLENMWDRVLTARLRSGVGSLLYGIACDDAHHYSGTGKAHPGRGWVQVRAKELSGDAIVGAMLAGDFYASTGVVLDKVRSGECGLLVRVAAEPGAQYRIRFLGSRRDREEAGVLLQESEGPEAWYEFRGDELYVRAVVLSDRLHPDPTRDGEVQTAWVQPVAVSPR
jgi:hypothetical protein